MARTEANGRNMYTVKTNMTGRDRRERRGEKPSIPLSRQGVTWKQSGRVTSVYFSPSVVDAYLYPSM